ncbi:MAG: hypothetical protein WC966_05180 [Bradymonadales bacterium]|jgi:hypothetical protein
MDPTLQTKASQITKVCDIDSRTAEQTKEAEKSKETQFTEALDAQSASQALAVLNECSDAERMDFGKNASMMESLLAQTDKANRNACMDLLYEHVTVDSVLERFVEVRFNTNVGSGSKKGNKLAKQVEGTDTSDTGVKTTRHERSWDLAGLERLYACYLNLPQSHIDAADSILTTSNTVTQTNGDQRETARWGGVAYYNYNSYVADYDSDNIDRLNATAYCTDDNDANYYLPMLDTTIVHELGHIVDGRSHRYGWSDEFMAFNGWVKTAGSTRGVNKIVNQMEEDCTKAPYVPMTGGGEGLNEQEKKVARRGAEILIKNHAESDTVDEVEKALTKATNEFGYKFTNAVKDAWDSVASGAVSAWNWLKKDKVEHKADDRSVRGLDTLASYLYETPIYRHILGTALCYDNHIPCYQIDGNNTTSYMNRATFEGYKGRAVWNVSLSNWNNKITRYQFRCPEEDFAETYACYHVSKMQAKLHEGKTDAEKKYKGIRPEVQAWFERMNLHRDPPKTDVSASSEPLGK